MPEYSVIVIDDLFTEVAQSKDMSYLFRVLSSKKKLHVIVMTQRYYAEGSHGLNIRNCSNYHVLMSNADARTNLRVGFSMNLDKDIRKAIEVNKSKLYPYIVVDRTNHARVNGVQIYTDILDEYKKVIINGNVLAMVPDAKFRKHFDVTDDGFGKPKEIKPQEKKIEIRKEIDSEPEIKLKSRILRR